MKIRENHKTKNDYRNPYDPFNNYSNNYNKNQLNEITCEIFHNLIPYVKCFKCKGPNEDHIPTCITTCYWKWHGCGSNSKYIVCESKGITGFLISKTHLIFNYMNRFPFIFRFGSATGISIHHINMVEEDDTPSNLIPVLSKIHLSLHLKYSIRKKKILNYLKNNQKNEISKLINECEEIKNSFNQYSIEAQERILYIQNEIKKCIQNNKIYEPTKKWGSNTGSYLKGRQLYNEM